MIKAVRINAKVPEPKRGANHGGGVERILLTGTRRGVSSATSFPARGTKRRLISAKAATSCCSRSSSSSAADGRKDLLVIHVSSMAAHEEIAGGTVGRRCRIADEITKARAARGDGQSAPRDSRLQSRTNRPAARLRGRSPRRLNAPETSCSGRGHLTSPGKSLVSRMESPEHVIAKTFRRFSRGACAWHVIVHPDLMDTSRRPRFVNVPADAGGWPPHSARRDRSSTA